MPTIAANTYVEATLTRSWGVSPGSASVNLPGEVSTFEPGDDVVLNIGGLTFHGVVSARNPGVDGTGGIFTKVTILDNRIHLQWDIAKGTFNNTEVRADNPATPGIDRQRRYWNILPADFAAQKKTWQDDPMAAAEIVSLLNTSTTDNPIFEWEIDDPDELLQAAVYEIDASNGAKLGSVLSEICSQLGILFTCTGTKTLLFARKGTGDAPYVDPAQQAAYSYGTALSHADTHIEVVGGRNVYQDNEVVLEPWWNANYEAYVPETDWLAEVESIWGSEWSGETDPEVKALRRSIKSRQVTVRDYAKIAGSDHEDHGLWGEVSRMEMPVWRYLRDIVFKAYRVPRDYVLAFAELDETRHLGVESLTFHEHLLGAVDYDSGGNMYLLTTPARQWYPPDTAFILAQGFRVSAVDPKLVKVLTPEQLAAARTQWAPVGGFTLDPRPESLGVIFDEPLVVDTSENPFFLFPNRDKAGITSTHPLYNVAVPNADFSASAPVVKMAIAWDADKYLKKFGSGPRWGTAHSEGIAGHYIMQDGVVVEEVPWPDDSVVDDKASAFVANLLAQEVYFDVGTIKRVGGAGTELNGVIDRVTVTVNMAGGLTEGIDLTKERVPNTYFPARLLDRLARFHDLFPGQKANRIEIQQKQALLQMKNLARRTAGSVQQHKDLQDMLTQPVGNAHSAPQMLDVGTTPRAAGQPIWKDETTGAVADDGTVFAGVIIADQATGTTPHATQGVVPVRIKGPFTAGDAAGVTGTNDYAQADGERPLGRIEATYTGTDTVLAPVHLGRAAGGRIKGFQLVDATERDGDGVVTARKIRIVASTINGELPTGMSAIDVPQYKLTVTGTGEVYAQVTFDEDTAEFSSMAIDKDTTTPESTDTTKTYKIGGYKVPAEGKGPIAVNNLDYGPLTVTACRNWFSSPKTYAIEWKGTA